MLSPISSLHFITHGSPNEQIKQAQEACEAGIRWIQMRLKNTPDLQILKTALEIKSICMLYNAIFIVNDHVHIAVASDADGVHLGKEDAPPENARVLLGPSKIIGGTANTIQDIEALVNAGVDYIGLGPYRFTSTKEKLSPTLGLAGYQKIMQEMKEKNWEIPVIAIGGLRKEDLASLLLTGIHGIAVSSAITSATDKQQVIETFIHSLSRN